MWRKAEKARLAEAGERTSRGGLAGMGDATWRAS